MICGVQIRLCTLRWVRTIRHWKGEIMPGQSEIPPPKLSHTLQQFGHANKGKVGHTAGLAKAVTLWMLSAPASHLHNGPYVENPHFHMVNADVVKRIALQLQKAIKPCQCFSTDYQQL